MSDIFPYGNDLSQPKNWVGLPETKSKYYDMRPIEQDGLMIIVLGIESMSIGLFKLRNISLSVKISPGKLFKKQKSMKKQAADIKNDIIEKTEDTMENIKDINDDFFLDALPSTDNPKAMWDLGSKNASLVTGLKPFSLLDLNEFRITGVSSVSAELIGKGALDVFWITNEPLFETHTIYATDDSAYIGGGMSSGGGYFDLIETYRPYQADGFGRTKEERLESYSKDFRPLKDYETALSYFRYLPTYGQPVSKDVIEMGENYAKNKSYR